MEEFFQTIIDIIMQIFAFVLDIFGVTIGDSLDGEDTHENKHHDD